MATMIWLSFSTIRECFQLKISLGSLKQCQGQQSFNESSSHLLNQLEQLIWKCLVNFMGKAWAFPDAREPSIRYPNSELSARERQ